ncbi:MAG: hypothetical protein IJ252_09300 [Solobacterium sp.]|nr:hypothetical protein [Solobacterium sp.]
MFDSTEMYNLGIAFINSGEANFREGVIKHRSIYQNAAGIVNLAFACELFLKCLLNMAGNESKGHNIEDLWKEYRRLCVTGASAIESSVMNRLHTDLTFEEMLHNDSDVFYNYRYLYDPDRLAEIRNNQLRPQFLRVFAFELCGCICKELKRQMP